MSNIELILNETSSLEFETSISGLTNESIEVQFVIESDGYGMTFKGNLLDGIVSVDFPILSNVLEAKTYDAKLVFIVEGTKYFNPMTTKIDFIQPISITTNVKQTPNKKVVKETTDVGNITVGTVKVTKTKSVFERLDENIDALASAKDMSELVSIYNTEILLKENAETDAKDAISFINDYCVDKFGKTFKEYIGSK